MKIIEVHSEVFYYAILVYNAICYSKIKSKLKVVFLMALSIYKRYLYAKRYGNALSFLNDRGRMSIAACVASRLS